MIEPLVPPGAFPALLQDPGLAYLDAAATALRPAVVIETVARVMAEAGPVHRASYRRAQLGSERYEAARARVAAFLGGAPPEIVFVRGATEALSAVARDAGAWLAPGDEVLVTALEHHANLWPWTAATTAARARLVVAPAPDGRFDADVWLRQLSPRTRVIALAHVANAFGTPLPVAELVQAARRVRPDVLVVVDGAQAVAHEPVRPRALGADVYVFSAHKLHGPGGIGVLWARAPGRLTPWLQGGGLDEPGPRRLEAGSPDAALAAGLAAALDFVEAPGWDAVAAHAAALVAATEAALGELPGVRLLGGPVRRAMVSFVVDGVHAHDVASFCDAAQVAVRAGHHCAAAAHAAAGCAASTRASFGVHTSGRDIERLVTAVADAVRALAPRRRAS